jgi:tetratricopeptide (TPR) repeat protein
MSLMWRAGILVFAALLVAPANATLADDKAAPPDGENRFNVGLDHLRAGRLDLAVESFQTAIKENPKNPYFYKGLGITYLRLRRIDDAIDAFRKALDLNPYYVDVRNDLGSALLLAGKRDEGRKELLAAFSDPTNPNPEQTARNLGQAYLDERNYKEALNWFLTSVQKDAKYPDAYIGLGDTLVAMGRFDDAIKQLETGAKQLPNDMNVALQLGEAYYRAARFGEARAMLEQVAGKDPAGPAGRRAVELLAKFPK